MFENLKIWAKKLKKQVFVLYFAYQDHRTPLYAKLLVKSRLMCKNVIQ
jgi:uncharacterized membrane protein YkvA (DUF1232 family)